MTSSKWSSCTSAMIFKITAMGRMDGQPINSGDIVSLSSKAYGTSRRLRCGTSTNYKCYVDGYVLDSVTSTGAQNIIERERGRPKKVSDNNDLVVNPSRNKLT